VSSGLVQTFRERKTELERDLAASIQKAICPCRNWLRNFKVKTSLRYVAVDRKIDMY
jgi:hypothetical protein